MMTSLLLAAAEGPPDPMSHVLPHTLFGLEWFTNHHFMALVVLIGGVLLFMAVAAAMPLKASSAEGYVTKGRVAQFFEAVCVFLRDEMAKPLLGEMTDRYIKYIWSVFFFVLFGNLLGMIPTGAFFKLIGLPSLSHLGGAMTGNISFTAGLALISMFMMIFVGLKENGFGFIKHMWPVPFEPLYLLPIMLPVGLLVFALELLGLVIKSFALCVRLFANMVAGHLVLGSLIILALTAPLVGKGASVLGAAAFSFLELFVAFLQAYIFTFLTVIFISLGAVHHDEHHDEHDHAHAHAEEAPAAAGA
ncbi:MAG: F0F1 ATP synthase subunit A [Planctomycetota bacterium]|jgi:F-type H+-transporting ATPase subunit a